MASILLWFPEKNPPKRGGGWGGGGVAASPNQSRQTHEPRGRVLPRRFHGHLRGHRGRCPGPRPDTNGWAWGFDRKLSSGSPKRSSSLGRTLGPIQATIKPMGSYYHHCFTRYLHRWAVQERHARSLPYARTWPCLWWLYNGLWIRIGQHLVLNSPVRVDKKGKK